MFCRLRQSSGPYMGSLVPKEAESAQLGVKVFCAKFALFFFLSFEHYAPFALLWYMTYICPVWLEVLPHRFKYPLKIRTFVYFSFSVLWHEIFR